MHHFYWQPGELTGEPGAQPQQPQQTAQSINHTQKMGTMQRVCMAALCLVVVPAFSFTPPSTLLFSKGGASARSGGFLQLSPLCPPSASLGFVAGKRMGRTRYSILRTSMSTVKDVAAEEDLLQVVRMASQPLPGRPDGTVTVIMYTSVDDWGCKSCEAEFERMSERRPDTVFLRCYKEYQGADMFLSARSVTTLPSFEVFYRDARVATVTGPQLDQVEGYVKQFGFVTSKQDFFSADASKKEIEKVDENGEYIWDRMAEKAARDSKRGSAASDVTKGPRTTMRFLPGSVMGTDGDEYRKNGSLMDFFQANRQPGAQKGNTTPVPDNAPFLPAGLKMPEGVTMPEGIASDDPLDRVSKMWDGEGRAKRKDDGKDDDIFDKIFDDYK